MSLKVITLAALAATAIGAAVPALAEIKVEDAYARVSTPMSKSAAAFMVISNDGDTADRLVDVISDISKRTELHTHKDDGNGNMSMVHVEEGFEVPAGGEHVLTRGGDHVMFMGLGNGLAHGDVVPLTLVFENAGEISIEVTVDLERKPEHGKMMKHGHKDH
ncbi:MAG: copper chaperone PCu(A)C [Shimia sp.]|jgi:hypothetical protein|uniref:copper chaperone PCu(A)C n=1 Tax=Shimia sp. TaxID=1954381 RepID=UPI00405915F8